MAILTIQVITRGFLSLQLGLCSIETEDFPEVIAMILTNETKHHVSGDFVSQHLQEVDILPDNGCHIFKLGSKTVSFYYQLGN